MWPIVPLHHQLMGPAYKGQSVGVIEGLGYVLKQGHRHKPSCSFLVKSRSNKNYSSQLSQYISWYPWFNKGIVIEPTNQMQIQQVISTFHLVTLQSRLVCNLQFAVLKSAKAKFSRLQNFPKQNGLKYIWELKRPSDLITILKAFVLWFKAANYETSHCCYFLKSGYPHNW